MTNREMPNILKEGIQAWNKWREDHPGLVSPDVDLSKYNDLSGINLSFAILELVNFRLRDLRKVALFGAWLNGADLEFANLSGANLVDTQFTTAVLHRADLSGADLSKADLDRANLRGANLSGANLRNANLKDADLSGAKLVGAKFNRTDLSNANLSRAKLDEADFRDVNLSKSNLSEATMSGTTFANVDLSKSIGLDSVLHMGQSTIGTNTLHLSRGKIPETFLRGCGLSDWEIEAAKLYDPNLTNQEMDEILYRVHDIRAHQPIQIAPLFISYSHIDSVFVDRMEKSLDKRGIRFWRDIHQFTSGPLEKQIDRAISQNPTVLVVLSENSTKSDWVQHEVRKAREIEKDIGRHVLCPLRLDDTFFSSPWPERIKEQVMEYNILDFSEWEDNDKFEKMFTRLIDGLNIFYKKEEE